MMRTSARLMSIVAFAAAVQIPNGWSAALFYYVAPAKVFDRPSVPNGETAIVTHRQFLAQLGEMLETEAPLTGTEALKDLEGWDSLAAIGFIALADEACGIRVAPKDLPGCNTVNDLLALVSAGFENTASPEQP